MIPKTLKIVIFAALMVTFFGVCRVAFKQEIARRESRPQTYRVALRTIPDRLNPLGNQLNTNHFILLHLYYPLFNCEANAALGSEFLNMELTRALSKEFQQFRLCLRDGIKFSDESPIQVEDLENTLWRLHSIHEGLSLPKSIKKDGAHCLLVDLAKADSRYFDRLTGVSSTILRSSKANDPFPVGLGPYQVAEHSPKVITLQANAGRVAGDFKKIEFLAFTDLDSARKAGVQDFNHLYQLRLPEDLKKQYQKIVRPFFKSYAIVVNHLSEKHRKTFGACFPTRSFIALLPMDLLPIAGFLPNGVPGALPSAQKDSDHKKIICRHTKGDPALKFLSFDPSTEKAIAAFFEKNKAVLPFTVSVVAVTPAEMVRTMFSADNVAAVIGFDSSEAQASVAAESAAFFESFIRTNRSERLVSEALLEVKVLAQAAAKSNDLGAKENLYAQAHRALLASGTVIPLGQLDAAQYYPPEISNIQWQDRVAGYPRIDAMNGVLKGVSRDRFY